MKKDLQIYLEFYSYVMTNVFTWLLLGHLLHLDPLQLGKARWLYEKNQTRKVMTGST